MPDAEPSGPLPRARRVRTEIDGDVAVMLLANAPVNTLDTLTRTDLLDALVKAEHNNQIRSVVLTGESDFFSAGTDLAEFDDGRSFDEPTLQHTVIGFIESMSKPVVAALRGYALGGGFELALACHYRVAHPHTRLALPECSIGLLPGAGGTQLLPRAIGIERAVDAIITGAPISVSDTADTPLIDEVLTSDFIPSAVQFARSVSGLTPLPRLRDNIVSEDPTADLALLAIAGKSVERGPLKAAHRQLAIEALEAAVTAPDIDTGRKKELDLFHQALGSAESAALRYRFLAERRAYKRTDNARGRPKRAVVIGAGTMGRGIATTLIGSGIEVTIHDVSTSGLEAGVAAIRATTARAVERGRLTPEDAEARLALLQTSDSLDCAAEADLVVEAAFENPDVKASIFRQLGAVAAPGALLATNTSTLDIDPIAAASGRPHDVVGMHFFSPADVMKLVEVIPGAKSSEQAVQDATELARTLGKLPVLAGNAPGFIGNRLIDAYLRQALQIALQGAAVSRIDEALREFGMAIGPFEMMDLVGNDILWHARAASVQTPDTTLDWSVADKVSEAGFYGRKSGTGWYQHGTGTHQSHPAATALIEAHAREHSIPQRDWTHRAIINRCLSALVIEGARALEERVETSGSDIDLVLLNGYGFPPTRGGPMFYADTIGLTPTLDAIGSNLRDSDGDPFWEPPALLTHLASTSGRISTWRSDA